MNKEEFDKGVEEWHGGAGLGMELHEYLSMTWKEYCDYLSFSIQKCSCGARYKYKCSKESKSGYGKMCVKELKEQGQTVMDAQQAFEMIDNPVEANEGLIELLRLE